MNTREQDAVLEIRDLKVHFPIKRGFLFSRQVSAVKAVDGISFSVGAGETFGLVGESGSGKTTTGRAIIRLTNPTSGQILFRGRDITRLDGEELRQVRRHLGIVFQDPFGAFNPRMKAGSIVGEPLEIHGLFSTRDDYRSKVSELLEIVGLNPAMANRYPHEFSGGQRQRLGVARAIAARPEVIVLDEPVSALDVSIRAQIINLLEDLQDEFNPAYLFIGHDLSVVRHISERIAVMYLGRIVEMADRDKLFDNPQHPYTQALLSAVPFPDPRRERSRSRTVLQGDIPSPQNPPPGCAFHTRCPVAVDKCSEYVPELRAIGDAHAVGCIRAPEYGSVA